MPIFEYFCRGCNRIYSFLSLGPKPGGELPACPRCGATDLSRVPSTFAVARASAAPGRSASDPDPDAPDGEPRGNDPGDGSVDAELARMAGSLDDADAEDPRVMAKMMRRMAEVAGEPVTPAMDEMLRRLEAGEDPEALEEELGPQLEDEMGGEGSGAMPERDDGLYSM